MFKNSIFIITICLLISVPVLSKGKAEINTSDSTEIWKSDSTWQADSTDRWKTDSGNSWESDSGETWNWEDFKYELNKFHKKGKPVININYGLSKMSLKDFGPSFAKPNLLEIKIGHEAEYPIEMKKILKYHFTNMFLSYISTELSKKKEADGLKSNLWRFGATWSSGYGYDLGGLSLIFFNSGSLVWSRLDMKDLPADSLDNYRMERFNNSFRFGTSAEAGIRLKISPFLAIQGDYERSIIFERHLFWKWAGSEIIYLGGLGIIDSFVDEIRDSSPYAVPLVSFVLKGALSYGIYELKQTKMNWPFKTVSPLAYNQFKFGVTIIF